MLRKKLFSPSIFAANELRVFFDQISLNKIYWNTSMTDSIFNFILALLEKHGPVPGADENEKLAYRFLETGHIDSFGLNDFIMEIEDEFDITLTPEDAQSEEFRTIGGLTEIIKSRVPSQP